MIETDPRLSILLQSTRLQPMLDSISEQLHACQSALNQYIDEKRSIFPRLYFLSDDDLLELLGQARAGASGREAVMQTHLKKLFPGISGVKLGPEGLSITALCSQDDDTLHLDHPVDIDSPVEIWLKNLEEVMRSTLKNMTLKCVGNNSLRDQDPFTLPTQILCLAQNIRFTEQVEKSIHKKELHNLKANIEKENSYYASSETDDESERYKRQALILQCTHYLTIIQILIENNVVATSDWHWQKQLRFYLLNTKEVVAKMGLATISYSYEYLGSNTGQFVRTELADECFLILTQSLHLGMVGNPFGPAGTGKTESVKALGGLVGRLVLIFNCDEAIDAECMGRLLSGLALSGAWGCFDEFNRLSAETLAAVSHQLASLLPAMLPTAKGSERIALLNGKQVAVSAWCGVAATMNPAGRGYGGRRALPAALQRALRPAALAAARPRRLAAALLAARALPHAAPLAADLHDVFTLASYLLSEQRHYDWGLRALKAAVGSCAAALTARAHLHLQAQRQIARRVLRLNNVSKLTNEDVERFENILSLVFANVPEEENTTNPITDAISTSFQTLGLIHNEFQAQKCIELYEQLQQRMGVGIVGPPGSGKTTIRQLLKNALTSQGKNIVEYIICPKAMNRNSLLGHIDHDTRQWTDGVISAAALEISNQPPDVWSWVVCDGDIEPEWVEALNSVLDDNRVLTLPSGWRVTFQRNVNFLFETHALDRASPATVSRMGIILLSEESSCAQEVLDVWLRKVDLENEITKAALPLLQQAIRTCLNWINKNKSYTLLNVYNVSLTKQILTQFEYIVQNVGSNTIHNTPEEIVYLAIERSILGLLKENTMDSFHEIFADTLGPAPVLETKHAEWAPEGLYLSARLTQCETILRAALSSDSTHLLLIGPEATAKNLLIEHVLKETNYTVITINCTPMLEPTDIIAELKRNNAVSAGSGSGDMVVVVRSLHRANAANCEVHHLLLQLIQHGGFWSVGGDEGGAQWVRTRRLRVVCAATVTSHSQRLANALAHVALSEPDDDEIMEIARYYLRQSLDKCFSEKDLSGIISSMLAMYKELTETFCSKPHYKWCADHMKRWCENIKWYSPSSIADIISAVSAEAKVIFKNRLISEKEHEMYNVISGKYLNTNTSDQICYTPKQKSDGVYLEAIDYDEWCARTQKLINQCLNENENVFGDSGVEVSVELAVLYTAIARSFGGGGAVCVCGAGAGRRAAARLAATAANGAAFCLHHHHQYLAVLRNALASAGEGTRSLLIISELAVTTSVLSVIEAIMRANSVHEIPANLMPPQNAVNTFDVMKQHLGIVICLDKDQENIWELMENYPLLHEADHLVWIERWSSDTLRQMPSLILQRLSKENFSETSREEVQTVPTDNFIAIYESLEKEWLRSPCRYVSFIKTYFHVVAKKKHALTQRQNMLSAGVEALRRARVSVAALREQAAGQEAALRDKQAAASRALAQIAATVRANTDRREEMHALKAGIEAENDKLQIRKKEIEAELASVEPVIAAARAAVGDIRPEALSEIRSMRAPPDVVRDVLEGVLRLMGIADTSWHSMKNFLSKRGVKEDIRCLDAEQIGEESAEAVRRLVASRGASFEAAAARRASAACAPLAAWVRANLAHAAALHRVRPLRAQQRHLAENLQAAEEQLSSLSSGLASVEERVESLQQQLGQHSRDAAALELKLEAANASIAAAASLLNALAAEYDAWETDLEQISKEILDLNHRSMLAAAFIVYLPDESDPQAKEYLKKWSALIGFEDPSFSVVNFLASTERQLKWHADGLPSDASAIKNAVLIEQVLQSPKCGFTPLIIDPDGEAVAWLKNHLADAQCDFISQYSDKLVTAVQYAVRLNRTLVITDVDEVHPSWWQLVRGGSRLILVGRFLPTLPPTCASQLALIDFTAGQHALTDQLVHYALRQLKPEINEKWKEIKLKKATLQKQQHELQENLLSILSTNGDILHDTNLLASLNKTRETSTTITEALEAALVIENDIQAASEAYRPSASRSALLALAVKRLATQRPLISLPIDVILEVFVDALKRGKADNIDNNEIMKYITRRIIERVLLGVHKKDKYKVVLHILKQIYEDAIPDKLWQLFLGNYLGIEDHTKSKEIQKSLPWIPDELIKKLGQLKIANEDFFNKLSLENDKLWKDFLESGDLNVISKLSLTSFETVVAVSILRPDSTYRAIVAFVDELIGAGLMTASAAVGAAARWGGARPALLLAAHAQDVLAAHAHEHARPLAQVGVEEGRAAWEASVEKARGGSWLALIVGASPITQELQNFITSFVQRRMDDFNDEFRLWIVAEDREIPPNIANSCVNVILEAPEGVKHNVVSTLNAWGTFGADGATMRARVCLALFHAIAQERRAYIPQGWSRWYAWEWGEVCACASALEGGGRWGRELVLALYGARAAAADRRALAALHRAVLGDHALAACWRPLGLPLTLPPPAAAPPPTHQAYISAFEALPNIDPPQLLGLPENCRVTWERNTATDIINGLKEFDTTVIGMNKTSKTNVSPLKMVLALWKKLMASSALIKGDYEPTKIKGGGGGWWVVVCTCEATAAARIARGIHRSLARCARARNAPPLHQTPEEWQCWWVGPAECVPYLREFCYRALAAEARISSRNLDTIPTEVDLRSFLYPERVIWAIRARAAERLGCSVHALRLITKWNATKEEAESAGGAVVRGLALAGGAWSAGAGCAPPRAADPPAAPAPPLLLRFVPLEASECGGPAEAEGTVEVPAYASGARDVELFVARAPLAAATPADTARLHALALLPLPAPAQ